MHRQVVGLKWAASRERGPFGPSRARGAKALGLRYERQLAKQLPFAAQHGKWFEFEDLNGRGWCQPDFYLIVGAKVVVIEAKYTWTLAGHEQVRQLYAPVLSRVFNKEVVGLVVCKRLVPEMTATAVASLEEAIALAAQDRLAAWHWIGGHSVGVGRRRAA